MVKLHPRAIEALGDVLLSAPICMVKYDGEQYCTRVTDMRHIATKRALEIVHALMCGNVVILCAPDHGILDDLGIVSKQVHSHEPDTKE